MHFCLKGVESNDGIYFKITQPHTGLLKRLLPLYPQFCLSNTKAWCLRLNTLLCVHACLCVRVCVCVQCMIYWTRLSSVLCQFTFNKNCHSHLSLRFSPFFSHSVHRWVFQSVFSSTQWPTAKTTWAWILHGPTWPCTHGDDPSKGGKAKVLPETAISAVPLCTFFQSDDHSGSAV